jgi:hypothetical protein
MEQFKDNVLFAKACSLLKLNTLKEDGVQNQLFETFMETPEKYKDLIYVLYKVVTTPEIHATQDKRILDQIKKDASISGSGPGSGPGAKPGGGKPGGSEYAKAYIFMKKFFNDNEDYEIPDEYKTPLEHKLGAPNPRYRFAMSMLPFERQIAIMERGSALDAIFETHATELKLLTPAEFIANRQVLNLLYDSIEDRYRVFTTNEKRLEVERKTAKMRVSVPDTPKTSTGLAQELYYLSSVLYAHGIWAEWEFLDNPEGGIGSMALKRPFNYKSDHTGDSNAPTDAQKTILESFHKEAIVKGTSDDPVNKLILSTAPGKNIENLLMNYASRIDISKIDIVAPVYMWLTSGQRKFAAKMSMQYIRYLKYNECINLLFRLLANYECIGINKALIGSDDDEQKMFIPESIVNAPLKARSTLHMSSLAIRYQNPATDCVVRGSPIKISNEITRARNYKFFFNRIYSSLPQVQMGVVSTDDALAEILKKLEEEAAESVVDATWDLLRNADSALLAEEKATLSPEYTSPTQAGGSIKDLVARANTRAMSRKRAYLSVTRKNVNRKHNKHTRKNK